MIFKSKNELDKFLLNKCKEATNDSYSMVCFIIDDCIRKFYKEFNSSAYIRTGELMKSFVKVGVKRNGNGFVGEVYFDADEMNHKLGEIETKKDYLGYATWSEEKIMEVALTGGYSGKPHGGYAYGSPIWEEYQSEIEKCGGIYELLEWELKRIGVPIKKT